jgi:hypothetical protein
MLRPVPFMGGRNGHCDAAEADLGSSLRARLTSGMAGIAIHKIKTSRKGTPEGCHNRRRATHLDRTERRTVQRHSPRQNRRSVRRPTRAHMCRSGASTSLQRPVVMCALTCRCISGKANWFGASSSKRHYQVNEIPHDLLHRLPMRDTARVQPREILDSLVV